MTRSVQVLAARMAQHLQPEPIAPTPWRPASRLSDALESAMEEGDGELREDFRAFLTFTNLKQPEYESVHRITEQVWQKATSAEWQSAAQQAAEMQKILSRLVIAIKRIEKHCAFGKTTEQFPASDYWSNMF